MKFDPFREEVFFTTVQIAVAEPSSPGGSLGTGFLVEAPVFPGQTVKLLVSTRHVLGDPNGQALIKFHAKAPSFALEYGATPALGPPVPMGLKAFKEAYRGHPDPNVDLACLNVSIIDRPELGIYHKTIPSGMAASLKEPGLVPGLQVLFLGYPENRFDTVHSLPLMRTGSIASLPAADFEGARLFVIDAQVFPGSSGSPVFAAIGNRYYFLGVVKAAMVSEDPLASNGDSVRRFLGLGLVVKSTAVSELVSLVIREIRETMPVHDASRNTH